MRVVFGLVRAFVWTTNRSYRVDISLGSSHRVFLVRALTGLHLDLSALFSQQVGPQGDFFACTSCLGWLGLSFEPLTAVIGVILGSWAHIACFSCGRCRWGRGQFRGRFHRGKRRRKRRGKPRRFNWRRERWMICVWAVAEAALCHISNTRSSYSYFNIDALSKNRVFYKLQPSDVHNRCNFCYSNTKWTPDVLCLTW